jgi:2-polyprenyl-6-methoxyphenol hydroxylase-like FAD-dependent oxidoreductase
MMLGMLLARAGVAVIVLEKHGDFLRDFRGDTIHPSTLELLHELGILEEFLRLPHQRMRQLKVTINDAEVVALDFSSLSTRCKYTATRNQRRRSGVGIPRHKATTFGGGRMSSAAVDI